MWYVRTCDKGKIQVYFIGVEAAEKATAENIVKGLKSLLQSNLGIDWDDFVKKIVALACDGASVMLGCKAGVAELIRKDQPTLVSVHCMAHRLELCLKDVIKKVPLYQKAVNVLLQGLYYFYHKSSLNNATLHNCFNVLKQEGDKLLVPSRSGGTRWIGHQRLAMKNFSISYKFIVAHLEQLVETKEKVSVDAKAKARAFLRLMKSKDTVAFILFMMDVLTPLRRLSLSLQDQDGVLANQHLSFTTTKEVVQKLHSSDGPHLRKVEGSTFQGTELTNTNAASFVPARKVVLEKFDHAINSRFAEFDKNGDVIQCTKVADLKSWPKKWDALKGFGDHEVQRLLDHFGVQLRGAGVDVEAAELEWTLKKKALHESDLQSEEVPDWEDVNRRFGTAYPNILALMDLVLTMAPSSAEAERGSSQLKLVKTNIRSSMGQDTLNNCLAVRLLSASIKEYDPLPAITHWNSKSILQRRPVRRPNVKINETETVDDVNLDNVENK